MAVAGDVLEQPETGWKRYELSSYPINEYPQINAFNQENGIIIQTPGNPADKIKIGSKIRVFGKIRNSMDKYIQVDNSMDIVIGPYPHAATMTYPVMPLTENKYTLIAEIELTNVYFLSTFIRFRGNSEYGSGQAVFSAIDIFEEEKTDILAVGRIGWWRFTNGDLTDRSGNGRHLVCGGTQVNTTDKDGVANNAVNLYNSSYYKTNDLVHPLFGLTEWAVCLWVNFRNWIDHEGFLTIKPDDMGYNGTWFADYSVSMHVNGMIVPRPKNGWHFVVWERLSTGYIRFYIDGVLYNTTPTRLTISRDVNDLAFGKRMSFKSRLPNADFDEISMYNRVLTADERAELLARGVNYSTDATPPSFNSVNIDKIAYNYANLNVNSNEDGKAYYKILPRDATAPTSAELKTSHNGTIVLTAYTTSIQVITSLTEDTQYDLYVVAEDLAYNLQLTPTKIQFTTLSTTPTRYIRPPKITVKENIVKIESHYKIYYTTDGSYPNSTSLHYTVPIPMPPNTTIITVIAFSQQSLSFSHPTQLTLYPQPTTTIYPPQ